MGGDLAGCRICSRFLVVLGRRPAVAKPLVATPRSRRPIRRFWVQTGELVSIKHARSAQSSPSVEKDRVCSPYVAHTWPVIYRPQRLSGATFAASVGIRHRGTAQEMADQAVYAARTRRTAAVTLRIVEMRTNRINVCPPATAIAATAHSASTEPSPT